MTDQDPVQQAPRRVVVAEDESLIRLDIVETLRDNGFEVVGEAGDGETAVALATELRPDLVIMDVKMPLLDEVDVVDVVEPDDGDLTGEIEIERDAGLLADDLEPVVTKHLDDVEPNQGFVLCDDYSTGGLRLGILVDHP